MTLTSADLALVCVSRSTETCVSLTLLLRIALGRDGLNSDFDFSISVRVCVFAGVSLATRALLWSDLLLVFKGETVDTAAPLNLRVTMPLDREGESRSQTNT